MASPGNYQCGLRFAVILVCFLSCCSSRAVGVMKGREMVGSRPPSCWNRCLSCRPCMAALVIQPPQRKSAPIFNTNDHRDNGQVESYYLLSWKCKCGNKLFQP